MTTEYTDEESDRIIAEGLPAAERIRAQVAAIEQAREDQPARLTKARSEADEARGWSMIEEPWESLIAAVPAVDSNGQRTGSALTLPSITAKELFAARLAFDMLDAGLDTDNPDAVEEVKTRYFTELHGDTALLFLVCMAALETIADLVVPQMVDELETGAGNYDVRVMLAEARTKSWNGRVTELQGSHDHAGGQQ